MKKTAEEVFNNCGRGDPSPTFTLHFRRLTLGSRIEGAVERSETEGVPGGTKAPPYAEIP